VNKIQYFAGLILLVSCISGDKKIGKEIEVQLQKNEWSMVDLSKVAGPEWDSVCIFGPYSTNKSVKEKLGFDWNIEENSSIASSDAINVLAFTKNGNVLKFVEYPRESGDFADLSGDCFGRNNSKFKRENREDNRKNYK